MKKDHKTVKNELETQTLQAKNLVKQLESQNSKLQKEAENTKNTLKERANALVENYAQS